MLFLECITSTMNEINNLFLTLLEAKLSHSKTMISMLNEQAFKFLNLIAIHQIYYSLLPNYIINQELQISQPPIRASVQTLSDRGIWTIFAFFNNLLSLNFCESLLT